MENVSSTTTPHTPSGREMILSLFGTYDDDYEYADDLQDGLDEGPAKEVTIPSQHQQKTHLNRVRTETGWMERGRKSSVNGIICIYHAMSLMCVFIVDPQPSLCPSAPQQQQQPENQRKGGDRIEYKCCYWQNRRTECPFRCKWQCMHTESVLPMYLCFIRVCPGSH